MRPRFWASATAIVSAAMALVLGSCAAGSSPSSGARLTVYVSVPLSGSQAANGRAFAGGALLALRENGGKAAGLPVHAVTLDDATAGGWDPVQVAGDARQAAEDSTSIAFLGELDPAATKISEPITSQAGILQISPQSLGERARSTPARRLRARFDGSASAAAMGFAAMRETVSAIDHADEPTDRASVRHAWLGP